MRAVMKASLQPLKSVVIENCTDIIMGWHGGQGGPISQIIKMASYIPPFQTIITSKRESQSQTTIMLH